MMSAAASRAAVFGLSASPSGICGGLRCFQHSSTNATSNMSPDAKSCFATSAIDSFGCSPQAGTSSKRARACINRSGRSFKISPRSFSFSA